MLPAPLVGGFLPPALPAECGQAAASSSGLQQGQRSSQDHSPPVRGSMHGGGPFPPRAAPSPGSTASPPRLDEQRGTEQAPRPHKPRHGHHPSTAGAQKRSNFSMGFWAKNMQEGLSWVSPNLSCSILRGYKMAVKPVARQQLAQSHLGHLILEKQRQKPASASTCRPTSAPGRHLQAPPAPLFLFSTLGDPFPFCQEQLGAPEVSETSTGDHGLQCRTMYTSTLAHPC